MKKSLLFISSILVIAASCSKEIETAEINEPEVQKTIIKAVTEPMTKTTIDIVGTQGVYSWEADEEISVYNGTTALTFVSEDADEGTFSYSGGESTTTLSYGVSPASAYTAVDAENYKLELKSNYAGYKSNVSNAVMVAGAPVTEGGFQKFTFKHAAALIRFTYENVPVGTTGLKFSTSDKKINGEYTVSGTTPELTQAAATGTKQTTLTLASAVASANTTIVFYVPIPTGDYTDFTVCLFDGEGDIASTSKTMTCKLPATKLFTATKGGVINTPVITLNYETPATYNRINSTASITDGDYLIVCENSNVALDGSLDPIDVTSNNISISHSSGTITGSSAIDASAVTITNVTGGYTILTKSGLYLGHTGSKNTLDTSDEASTYINEISFSGNTATIAIGSYHIKYNPDSGQERFRYYTSAANVQLYKRSAGSSIPQLSVPQGLTVDAATKTVSWHTVNNAASYTLTIGGNDYSEGITVVGNTASKTVSAIEDEYYDVSVVAVSADPSTTHNSAAATLTDAKFGNPTLATPGTFVTGTVTDNSIQVSWTGDARATSYHCTISPADAEAQDPTSASVTFSGLTKGTSYIISVYAVDETEKYATSSTGSTESIKAEATASWHSESWSALSASSSYTNSSVVGDLGTWTYTGCCTSGQPEHSEVFTSKVITLGKKTTDSAKLTSPTFNSGISGIKFNYYVNDVSRTFVITVYEDSKSVKSVTVTPSSATTKLSYEDTSISTTKATYFTIIPNTNNRRVSIGDVQVKY